MAENLNTAKNLQVPAQPHCSQWLWRKSRWSDPAAEGAPNWLSMPTHALPLPSLTPLWASLQGLWKPLWLIWVPLELKITLPIAENNTFHINNNKDGLFGDPVSFSLMSSISPKLWRQRTDKHGKTVKGRQHFLPSRTSLQQRYLWSKCLWDSVFRPQFHKSFKEPHLCQYF